MNREEKLQLIQKAWNQFTETLHELDLTLWCSPEGGTRSNLRLPTNQVGLEFYYDLHVEDRRHND